MDTLVSVGWDTSKVHSLIWKNQMASLLIFRRKLINFLCLITLVFCTLSSYSQDIAQPSLDIDGNGKYDALTDGLLVLRNMFGLEGEALVNGALAPDAIYI